ncbi:MAG: ChaN family lipoprotein [Planctomycetota bacterium]
MPPPRLSVIPAALILAACSAPETGRPGAAGAHLRSYRESFAAAAGEALVEEVDRRELARRITASGAVWLGDQHRHARLHALHSELLEGLAQGGVELALGLEAIGAQDQPAVDDYLAGRIDMRALRRRLRARWRGSWLDDPELDPFYFRSLLSFARARGAPVFALEPTPRLPLDRRDEVMARAVAAARRRHPERVLAVVVGQAHLRGRGDLVKRSGVGGVVVGGEPPDALQRVAPPRRDPGVVWRSDQDLYWFAPMISR